MGIYVTFAGPAASRPPKRPERAPRAPWRLLAELLDSFHTFSADTDLASYREISRSSDHLRVNKLDSISFFRYLKLKFPDKLKLFSGTISPKGIVRFWSCSKAVVNVFPHKAEPS